MGAQGIEVADMVDEFEFKGPKLLPTPVVPPRRRPRPLLLALVAGLAISSSARGQPGEIDFAALEAVVKDEMKAAGIPGVVVMIVQGDRVTHAKGFGVASVETNESVTTDHLFRIGSTTKMFVGATLAKLAAEGKLKLHEPVGKLIDGLPPRLAAVTPHQLLTHSAGIADEAPMFGRHDDEALGDGIKKWTDDRLFTTPGDIHSYSNPGYWLAGYAAEVAAHKPFADVLADEMFHPLGMKRTTFRPTVAMTYPLAQGHELREGKPVVIRPAADNAATWPAGSMFTSGNDLARFVIAFMNGGRLDGEQVLAESLVQTMASPYVEVPGGGGHYGYGLTLKALRGVDTVSHSGLRSGYGSHVTMAPAHKVGVIVLGNRSMAALPNTVAKAAELLLPLGPEPKPPEAAKPPPQELASLAGTYRNGAMTIELRWADEKLVQVDKGKDRPVEVLAGSRFRDGAGEIVEVVRGQDGKTTYLSRSGRALRKQDAE
jgi:CubicO group peptidase (beta-lactamase class C family)